MEKQMFKSAKPVSKLPLWLLRGSAVAALSIAIFLGIAGYKIQLVPNEACAQSCIPIPQPTPPPPPPTVSSFFSASGTNLRQTNMGNQWDYCALTATVSSTGANAMPCDIYMNAGSWMLRKRGAGNGTCSAKCINFP